MTLDELERQLALLRLVEAGTISDVTPELYRDVYPLIRQGLVSIYTDGGNSCRVLLRLKQAGRNALASSLPTGHGD